nr:MAG TPA: hypothetical protein [Caudoviricetes sp.]
MDSEGRINRRKQKEDKKMKNYYRPNEHERYADFIEKMLKALKNKK